MKNQIVNSENLKPVSEVEITASVQMVMQTAKTEDNYSIVHDRCPNPHHERVIVSHESALYLLEKYGISRTSFSLFQKTTKNEIISSVHPNSIKVGEEFHISDFINNQFILTEQTKQILRQYFIRQFEFLQRQLTNNDPKMITFRTKSTRRSNLLPGFMNADCDSIPHLEVGMFIQVAMPHDRDELDFQEEEAEILSEKHKLLKDYYHRVASIEMENHRRRVSFSASHLSMSGPLISAPLQPVSLLPVPAPPFFHRPPPDPLMTASWYTAKIVDKVPVLLSDNGFVTYAPELVGSPNAYRVHIFAYDLSEDDFNRYPTIIDTIVMVKHLVDPRVPPIAVAPYSWRPLPSNWTKLCVGDIVNVRMSAPNYRETNDAIITHLYANPNQEQAMAKLVQTETNYAIPSTKTLTLMQAGDFGRSQRPAEAQLLYLQDFKIERVRISEAIAGVLYDIGGSVDYRTLSTIKAVNDDEEDSSVQVNCFFYFWNNKDTIDYEGIRDNHFDYLRRRFVDYGRKYDEHFKRSRWEEGSVFRMFLPIPYAPRVEQYVYNSMVEKADILVQPAASLLRNKSIFFFGNYPKQRGLLTASVADFTQLRQFKEMEQWQERRDMEKKFEQMRKASLSRDRSRSRSKAASSRKSEDDEDYPLDEGKKNEDKIFMRKRPNAPDIFEIPTESNWNADNHQIQSPQPSHSVNMMTPAQPEDDSSSSSEIVPPQTPGGFSILNGHL
eukprot:GDKJ01032171.1.p1 GENE.GDKJ01032171.1~~GDKJ01032171.1.p1  ORF type:complete len:813 (-),score=123.53 GDKJ01032171.1:77-2248(-)